MGAPIVKDKKIGTAPTVDVKKTDGTSAGSITLPAEIFALEPNVALMHQVVTAQLAAARAGTHSTKTRSEVSGGGAKPWRQKGTGRARAGSNRSPIWVGGGIAHGPKPRDYSQKTPRKMIQQALRSALSDRASLGQVIVLDGFVDETPSTKSAITLLKALEITDKKILLVLGDADETTYLSFRNLDNVHVIPEEELNTYDVLYSDYVIFTRSTVPGAETVPATAAEETK